MIIRSNQKSEYTNSSYNHLLFALDIYHQYNSSHTDEKIRVVQSKNYQHIKKTIHIFLLSAHLHHFFWIKL